MTKCSKCRNEVFSPNYIKIDNKIVCKICSKINNKPLKFNCPVCKKQMKIGNLGIHASKLWNWNIFASEFSYPYWYNEKSKEKFSKDQRTYICKKCHLLIVY